MGKTKNSFSPCFLLSFIGCGRALHLRNDRIRMRNRGGGRRWIRWVRGGIRSRNRRRKREEESGRDGIEGRRRIEGAGGGERKEGAESVTWGVYMRSRKRRRRRRMRRRMIRWEIDLWSRPCLWRWHLPLPSEDFCIRRRFLTDMRNRKELSLAAHITWPSSVPPTDNRLSR